MKFLKTLLWVVIVALVAVLAARNWRDVTVNLWGDLQADIKIPLLLLIMFMVGFLPSLFYRARYRRLARLTTAVPAASPAIADEETEPAP